MSLVARTSTTLAGAAYLPPNVLMQAGSQLASETEELQSRQWHNYQDEERRRGDAANGCSFMAVGSMSPNTYCYEQSRPAAPRLIRDYTLSSNLPADIQLSAFPGPALPPDGWNGLY